jgi:RNA polymerase sigma factor (sigma-70 family)
MNHGQEEHADRPRTSENREDHELSPRQRQIIELLMDGMTNREIAKRLELSARTVEMHRATLMRKLNLRSLSELVHYAVRTGIVKA